MANPNLFGRGTTQREAGRNYEYQRCGASLRRTQVTISVCQLGDLRGKMGLRARSLFSQQNCFRIRIKVFAREAKSWNYGNTR